MSHLVLLLPTRFHPTKKRADSVIFQATTARSQFSAGYKHPAMLLIFYD
jgi:hypothetical protein